MCTGCESKQFPSFSHDIANTLSEMDAAAATMVFIVGSSHGYISNKLGFSHILTKENLVVSYMCSLRLPALGYRPCSSDSTLLKLNDQTNTARSLLLKMRWSVI